MTEQYPLPPGHQANPSGQDTTRPIGADSFPASGSYQGLGASFPDQPHPSGGFPAQQPASGGFPAQQQVPGGYASPPPGFPAQSPPVGFPAQNPPSGGFPQQQTHFTAPGAQPPARRGRGPVIVLSVVLALLMGATGVAATLYFQQHGDIAVEQSNLDKAQAALATENRAADTAKAEYDTSSKAAADLEQEITGLRTCALPSRDAIRAAFRGDRTALDTAVRDMLRYCK